MSYGIKRLADVELLDITPENANKLVEVDGEVKRVPNKDNGLPEGGAPNQHLVTDADGVAQWEERLAYTMPPEHVEVIGHSSVNVSAAQGNVFAASSLSETHPDFVDFMQSLGDNIGKAFMVEWDGVMYECGSYMYDGPYIGNGSLIYGGSVESDDVPFLFIDDYDVKVISADSGEHTFAIYEPGEETVKPIDPKYLYDAIIEVEGAMSAAGSNGVDSLSNPKFVQGDTSTLLNMMMAGMCPRVLIKSVFYYGDELFATYSHPYEYSRATANGGTVCCTVFANAGKVVHFNCSMRLVNGAPIYLS